FAEAARREVQEETGLQTVNVLNDRKMFDLDVHWIPPRPQGGLGHYHYDVRFLLQAPTSEQEPLRPNRDEVHAACWFSPEEIPQYAQEESVLRMMRKWFVWKAAPGLQSDAAN